MASPTVSAAEGQRGPAAVAHDRAAREPLLEPEEQRERHAGDPGDGRQDERDEQRRDEQDARRRRGPAIDPGVTGGPRQDEHADERRRRANTTTSQRRRRGPGAGRVEPRLERLDRRDPAGAPGRLEGGRQGHRDADQRARRRWRRAGAPGARG